MMRRSTSALLLVLLVVAGSSSSLCLADTKTVFVDTLEPVSVTSDAYLSVTIDASRICHDFAPLNFTDDDVVITMARALAPAILRIGGTEADDLTYDMSSSSAPSSSSSSPGVGRTGCTLTADLWSGILGFAERAGWRVVFGLNGLRRASDGSWDPTNAQELLEYTLQHHPGVVLAWELGNEPDLWYESYNVTISPQQHAQDFETLAALVKQVYKSQAQAPAIVGPDCATLNRNNFWPQFLKAASASSVIDVITAHQYYESAAIATLESMYDPMVLDKLQGFLDTAVSQVQQLYSKETPFFIGETSSCYDGGAKGLSNAYAASFMWLDKLGMAARLGAFGLARQDLYGGFYGLLNRDTLQPLPDYWTAVLHRRLVRNVTFSVHGDTAAGRTLRVYAACGPQGGSVTLSLLNVGDAAVDVDVQGVGASVPRQEYHLTPGDGGNLQSAVMELSGKPLQLQQGALPPLVGVTVTDRSTKLTLQAHRIAYVVFPDAKVSWCN